MKKILLREYMKDMFCDIGHSFGCGVKCFIGDFFFFIGRLLYLITVVMTRICISVSAISALFVVYNIYKLGFVSEILHKTSFSLFAYFGIGGIVSNIVMLFLYRKVVE